MVRTLLGITLGYAPYKAASLEEIHSAMLSTDLTFADFIKEDAKNLIKGLLRMEARDRMPFSQIFEHEFVKRHLEDYKEKKKDYRLVMPYNHPYADVLINYYNPKIINKSKNEIRGNNRKFLDPYGGILSDPAKQQEYIRAAAQQSGIDLETVLRAKLVPNPQTGKVVVKFVLKEKEGGEKKEEEEDIKEKETIEEKKKEDIKEKETIEEKKEEETIEEKRDQDKKIDENLSQPSQNKEKDLEQNPDDLKKLSNTDTKEIIEENQKD